MESILKNISTMSDKYSRIVSYSLIKRTVKAYWTTVPNESIHIPQVSINFLIAVYFGIIE